MSLQTRHERDPADAAVAPVKARRSWLVVASALLLATATLSVAWATFQSTQWVKQRWARSDQSTDLARVASLIRSEASASRDADQSTFRLWIAARLRGEGTAARALYSLFREQTQRLVSAWLETSPIRVDGSLKSSPFESPTYDVRRDLERVPEIDAESVRARLSSVDAARTAANYAFLIVGFASVLMLLGLANLFGQTGREVIVVVATVIMVVGVAWLITLPVEFDI